MVMGVQRHAPAALPPGKTRYPLYRKLGEPDGRSGRVRKILPPPGFDPRTVQPIFIIVITIIISSSIMQGRASTLLVLHTEGN